VPTIHHEELVELFRSDPTIAVDFLRASAGVELPAFDRIEVRPGEMRDLVPIEYRADVVVLLVKDKPVYAIILEVQLGEDWDKRTSWPLYQAVGRGRRWKGSPGCRETSARRGKKLSWGRWTRLRAGRWRGG
jgi:hypothetical protein